MVSSLHYRWWGQVFPNELFRRIHGSADHLKQILCYMHAWNHSSDQNSKTLRDAKKLKERWWVFSKWSKRTRKEVHGWVCIHHFLLMMIFWRPRNLNCHCRKRKKLWNIMEASWFFFVRFFLYFIFFCIWWWCWYIFQGSCNRKKKNSLLLEFQVSHYEFL